MIYYGALLAGRLILLPNVLDETLPHEPFLPISVEGAVKRIQGLFVESEKSARRYLRRFLSHDQMTLIPLRLLNEHTNPKELDDLLKVVLQGEVWGIVSDGGLPCIADPGADLVWLARKAGVEVETLTGPSSILMALQLSGFSGQQFVFHGYLPREEALLAKAIRDMEQNGGLYTQIWIEAPYRSAKMLEFLKTSLHPDTRLCVAVQLATPAQRVGSYPVRHWRAIDFPLAKEPAVFLIQRKTVNIRGCER